jgi:hypothetical protein
MWVSPRGPWQGVCDMVRVVVWYSDGDGECDGHGDGDGDGYDDDG